MVIIGGGLLFMAGVAVDGLRNRYWKYQERRWRDG